MSRLSNDEIKQMSLEQCESYSISHPKEASRIAKQTGKTTVVCARAAAENLIQEIFPSSFGLPIKS